MRTRHRSLLRLAATGLVGTLLVVVGTVAVLRGDARRDAAERLRGETALLADWVRDRGVGAETAQQFVMDASRRLGLRVTLVAASGTVLGDSARDAAGVAAMDSQLTRPEIEAAGLRGAGVSLRRSATTNVVYLYTALLVEDAGAVSFVRVALPVDDLYRGVARVTPWLVVLAAGTMLLLVAIGYAGVRGVSRPIEDMTRAIESAAEHRGPLALPGGDEEVGHLAGAVGRMRSTLLDRLDQLEAERALLASAVSGMREALLLVGADRRVRLFNRALREIFDLGFDPRGHVVEEVVRHPAVLDHLSAALTDGQATREAVIHFPGTGRAFQLEVTPLRGADGPVEAALLLLFDVTRMERLEGVRREFVANVSHELRTPLTSLAASVETLLEGGLEDRPNARRFLEIIRKHAERMSELIEDLTDLSLIETGSISLDRREVDAAEAARGIVERLQPLADARRVALALELPAPFRVLADRRRLEQILINLVDNAIKFNKPGGTVTLRGERHTERILLRVEDTGIGIPEDSLERVFHRFHQVDRDRSRRVGGTGLGLAIVKHLMRLHGGSVHVESELGQGAAFILEFPALEQPRRTGTG